MTSTRRDSANRPVNRWFHHYTRGVLLLVALAITVRVLMVIFPGRVAATIWEWLAAGPERWLLVGAVVIFVPFLVGWTVRRLLFPLFARRRTLGWTLQDLLSFSVTYGAVVPNPAEVTSELAKGAG